MYPRSDRFQLDTNTSAHHQPTAYDNPQQTFTTLSNSYKPTTVYNDNLAPLAATANCLQLSAASTRRGLRIPGLFRPKYNPADKEAAHAMTDRVVLSGPAAALQFSATQARWVDITDTGGTLDSLGQVRTPAACCQQGPLQRHSPRIFILYAFDIPGTVGSLLEFALSIPLHFAKTSTRHCKH